jgi:hypothetical protein
VYQPTRNVETEAKKPKDDENDDDCVEHMNGIGFHHFAPDVFDACKTRTTAHSRMPDKGRFRGGRVPKWAKNGRKFGLSLDATGLYLQASAPRFRGFARFDFRVRPG